jgi:hypothetical protein
MPEYSCPEKIYKYLSYDGLEKTLERESIRLSRPIDFNDPLDMFLQEVLGMEVEDFLQGMKEAMVEFLASEIDYNALRESPNRAKIIIMNMAFKNARPEDIDNWRRDVLDTPIEEIYDIEKLQCSNDEMTQLIKESFNTDGIFCSTVESNNLLMWAHYADQHRGAVMEFTPSVQKEFYVSCVEKSSLYYYQTSAVQCANGHGRARDCYASGKICRKDHG